MAKFKMSVPLEVTVRAQDAETAEHAILDFIDGLDPVDCIESISYVMGPNMVAVEVEDPQPTMLHVATITHKFGSNAYVATTREILDGVVADWCREYWGSESIDGEPPHDDEECIEEYFGRHMDGMEYVEFDTTALHDKPLAPKTEGK